MVYVLDRNGQPLMPTMRHGKVRHLLKEGRAKVIRRCPFTIQLLYESSTFTEELTLGVDAGSKYIGISVSSEQKEYYSSQVELRTDIVDNLSTRREFRRARRNRKTRYRSPRFQNRTATKKKGWLAPSIRQKCESHLTVIEKTTKLLPITKIVIEAAAFDLQKLKADRDQLKRPKGEEYQRGEQMGFWNAREYVLWRDNHTCQSCKGKSGDRILNVHHIQSRKIGGDAPDNLVTLCEYCHKKYHSGQIRLSERITRKKPLKDAAFMGIMRWTVWDKLKETYCPLGIEVGMTYGYLTKNTRIEADLPKEHRVDALCIAKHPKAKRIDEWYLQKKIRCHNRQLHKAAISKGGKRKKNQAPYLVKGFRLFDKVRYGGKIGFISGRRSSGYFAIRTLDGTYIHKSAKAADLKLLERKNYYLTERRCQVGAV